MNANLLEAAKSLPLPERIELAEALWESITDEGHEPPLTPAQADELDRRLEDIAQSTHRHSLGSDQGGIGAEVRTLRMSLPIVFRSIAGLELDEAMAWYKNHKEGLELEFKDAVDQMLEKIAATPLRFHPIRGEVRVPYCGGFPTPSTSCLDRTRSSCSPCSTPNGTRAIWKEESEPFQPAARGERRYHPAIEPDVVEALRFYDWVRCNAMK